ncbi:SLC13 family permease [Marinobacter persicus]|uniref:Di/tricarboxylate transporter n=1 Tax=Marinobacter persicus TaxID=930118 RepID=A0A2S6G6Y6_9GAMM|nr:SLC13 family permease [Marinobacter persicus]PPK51655.1 di/tricarboxylate transporter [Marinobacter persicus]PPK54875.1 di/tricarboxylate transporter [Marinobacter persicus]PPK58593.1 di/tricarboxylate transporter [Marinobacter persicus]
MLSRINLTRPQWLALILIPTLCTGLMLSPAAGWFDSSQRLSALLVISGLVLFATGALPEFVSALLVLTLAMLLSLAPADVVFSGLTSTACWLIISGLVIGIAITETGLAQRLSDTVTGHLDSSYVRLITGIVFIGILLGFVMPSSVGRIVLFIPIALAIAENCGFEAGSNGQRGVGLAAAFGSHIPTFAILPANIPNMIMIGSAEKIYGWSPLFGEYLLLHFPVLGFLKALLLIAAILWFYPAQPQRQQLKTRPPSFSGKEIRLLTIMLATLGLWLTDSLHQISVAWIGLAAATLLLLPGVGMISTQSFNQKVNLSAILVVGGLLGIAALINHQNISQVVGTHTLDWMPLSPENRFTNFMVLSLTATFTGILTTLAGIPATLTPLGSQISELTGFSLEAVLMTQVLGFSTVVFTYQSVPLMMAMPLAGIPIRHAGRLCLVLSALSIAVLFPLDYFWWRWLGWI